MSILPSFKARFSSLAEADTPPVRNVEDSGAARSPPHRPWSPLPTSSSDRRPTATTTTTTNINTTTTNPTPSSRPAVPPLPLDNLVGEAPAFGFARTHKSARKSHPSVDPLPLEVLGLAVDGLVYVRAESKRTASPPVHAGAYKRPRRHSVSAGGSYVKVSSQPSADRPPTAYTSKLHEQSSHSDPRDPSQSNTLFRYPKPRDSPLPHISASLSSGAHNSSPSESHPTHPAIARSSVVPHVSSIPHLSSLKTSNILSFAPPSLTRSAGSKGQVLSFQTQMVTGAAIIEDSTCRVPIDVLSSPTQRSLNSGGTGTGPLRGITGNTLSLARGPTASDLSHLLGPARSCNDDDVGSDAAARENQRSVSQPPPLVTSKPLPQVDRFEGKRNVDEAHDTGATKSQAMKRESNLQQSSQQPSQSPQPSQPPHPPQPPLQPPPPQPPPRQAANLISALSGSDFTLRRTPSLVHEGDKHIQSGSTSYLPQSSSTLRRSHVPDLREEERLPEPWRQQPRPQQPRPQRIDGITNSQPIVSPSREHSSTYLRATSSSHLVTPYESRNTKYNTAQVPSMGRSENSDGARWHHARGSNENLGFLNGRQEQNLTASFLPNYTPAATTLIGDGKAIEVQKPNGHAGHLDNVLGRDLRDDSGSVPCPHCPKKLRNHVTLQNHIRVVHDHSGNFRCPQPNCGLTFMWQSTLGNHVRLVHEKQRPHPCEHCTKAFRWESHLREHIWVVHKGEKPFRCEKCGKTFGRKNNMQKHMKRHTEGAS